ncbi:MAG: ParA family protein [Acidimicrobiaceae bacterium]|nr:ParA family protein [Acidimicrobiaceae bacterium]
MTIYGFWNNKGGTGKTSLTFQSACFYAAAHPDESVLVIDMCPQANVSELFLGGLVNNGSQNLLQQQGNTPRASIGGYFELRLPAPYSAPAFQPRDFITKPCRFNRQIPENVDLIAGDPLLELQANAMSTLANNQIPGTNTWLNVVDWLRDLLEPIREEYEVTFIDSNPSFSIYTQIALSVVDSLVLPVMADDSSRRAVQNAFSLIHGLMLPSPIYADHNFASRLLDAGRTLPTTKLVVRNRITQYMGDASGYAAVLRAIEDDVMGLLQTNPEIFDFAGTQDGFISVRDFQTCGVVAAARGCPIDQLTAGKKHVKGRRVQVDEQQRQNCVKAIKDLVSSL